MRSSYRLKQQLTFIKVQSAHLHSIYSHKPRAQSGAAYRDWHICSGIPDAPLFPVTDHMSHLLFLNMGYPSVIQR